MSKSLSCHSKRETSTITYAIVVGAPIAPQQKKTFLSPESAKEHQNSIVLEIEEGTRSLPALEYDMS